MRKKLDPKDKRSKIVGVKVTPLMNQQLEYMADAAGEEKSTYIYNLLKARIEQYTKDAKINWEEELIK